MRIFLNLLINSLAVLVSAYILPGVKVDSYFTALVVAIILGIANAVLKPILVILTLPFTILTLGLFIFVINGILILVTSSLVPGFYVKNLWFGILFSLVISVVSSFLHGLT